MAVPIIGSIALAGATAAIGSFFQNRSEAIKRRAALREAELTNAREILKEVTRSADRLYYYLSNVAMYVAARKAKKEKPLDTDVEDWKAYQAARAAWETDEFLFSAQVERYFGPEAAKVLLELRGEFDVFNTQVWRTYTRKSARRGKSAATARSKAASAGAEDPNDLHARAPSAQGIWVGRANEKGKVYFQDYPPYLHREETAGKLTELAGLMMQHLQHQTVGLLREGG